jgi:diketogulonate reductase-like aldo/keto reductase
VTDVTSTPTYHLNDGHQLPQVGLGTYGLRGEDGTAAIVAALETGYRMLDTAVNYENEAEVGEALRRSGLPREEVVVTSKIPGRHHAYADAVTSTEASLGRLGLDYLDLHLIHWPNPGRGLFGEAWRALVDLRERGLVRSVGVSNFTEAHLDRVIDQTGVTPAVNQIELHPLFPQPEMRAVHERLGIRTESWSPLGKRQAQYAAAPVRAAAERHGVSPAQVILRWHVELGAVPIPKSGDPARQAENLAVFDFSLSGQEVDAISALARPDGRLFGGDPDSHEEM